jgi:hypothetical protein
MPHRFFLRQSGRRQWVVGGTVVDVETGETWVSSAPVRAERRMDRRARNRSVSVLFSTDGPSESRFVLARRKAQWLDWKANFEARWSSFLAAHSDRITFRASAMVRFQEVQAQREVERARNEEDEARRGKTGSTDECRQWLTELAKYRHMSFRLDVNDGDEPPRVFSFAKVRVRWATVNVRADGDILVARDLDLRTQSDARFLDQFCRCDERYSLEVKPLSLETSVNFSTADDNNVWMQLYRAIGDSRSARAALTVVSDEDSHVIGRRVEATSAHVDFRGASAAGVVNRASIGRDKEKTTPKHKRPARYAYAYELRLKGPNTLAYIQEGKNGVLTLPLVSIRNSRSVHTFQCDSPEATAAIEIERQRLLRGFESSGRCKADANTTILQVPLKELTVQQLRTLVHFHGHCYLLSSAYRLVTTLKKSADDAYRSPGFLRRNPDVEYSKFATRNWPLPLGNAITTEQRNEIKKAYNAETRRLRAIAKDKRSASRVRRRLERLDIDTSAAADAIGAPANQEERAEESTDERQRWQRRLRRRL